MLNGLTGSASANEGAKKFQLGCSEFAFKLEIEAQAGQGEGVGDEEFGLESGRG